VTIIVARTMPPRVMAGLGPATHDLRGWIKGKSWVTGPSPIMTQGGNTAAPNVQDRSNLVQLFLRVALDTNRLARLQPIGHCERAFTSS
jgi:hypothetical protein